MTVSELIELLEEFKEDFGDLEVAVNRNGRDYPVFIKSNGVFPGHADERQLRDYSGYFKYLDDDYEEESLDNVEVPCPECEAITDYQRFGSWSDAKFVCPSCGLEISEDTVRSEFLDEERPNLCILND
jgi:hypothetical protein